MESIKRFTENEKFITLGSLERFKDKFKTYVDAADKVTADKVTALENTVGDSTKGLVQKVNLLQGELDGLNGGAGSITTQIENAISALDLPNTYEAKGEAAKAETAAKAYADGLAANYEAAGALDAAKAYTDELANGSVAQHTATLAELTGTGDNSINAKVATAIAGVVDGAPEAFDTLKEVEDWILNHKSKIDIITSGTMPAYVFDKSTQYITGGVGYRNKRFYTDLAYVHKKKASEYKAFAPTSRGVQCANITDNNNQIVWSIGYRF